VGGICVYPGDLIHGDLNGVTTIPPEIAAEIPQVCEELAAAEKIVLDYVRGTNITPEGLTEARKAFSEAAGKVSQRVRRK
jgi:regulator of RNase E activity RraA